MSEVQKELEKAKTYEETNNFEKAAKIYLEVAESLQDPKLYNKAFFTARKTGKTSFMFECGRKYYNFLVDTNQAKMIKDFLPNFLDLSGRMRDNISDQKPEVKLDILNWVLDLYQRAGNQEGAYEISMETGDTYFAYGKQFLSSSHLLGKEEKYNRGVELFNLAVESYQSVRLDVGSLKCIIDLKLEKMERFIDINRITEAIEDTDNLMRYFKDQDKKIHPYTQQELSLKIADVLARKTLEKANKQTEIANTLRKTAVAGFMAAKTTEKIPPFLWTLSQVVDEGGKLKIFLELSDEAFHTAIQYKDTDVQQSIISYLQQRGSEECVNTINSRLLMVKKGQIEFQNHKGIEYLLHRMKLAKVIDNKEILSEVVEYLFDYANQMYEKKLRKRSVPYYEFCARSYFDLSQKEQAQEVTSSLQTRYEGLLNEGKIDDAAVYLISIIDLFTHFGDIKKAGDSAFSFAKTLGERGKTTTEFNFLERAYTNFEKEKETGKLQELLDYIITRSDPLFTQDEKIADDRNKLLELASNTASAISNERQGEVLEATTMKSINSGLLELASQYASQAFDVFKSFNTQRAADFYFQVASMIITKDLNSALEYISQSTTLVADEKSQEELVLRNLQYLMDQTISAPSLDIKLTLIGQFETISSTVKKSELYSAFLLPFVKNLAEMADDQDYFIEMNNFLLKAFTIYHEQDNNHPHLHEIIEWVNDYIPKLGLSTSLLDMVLLSLKFHEKINQPSQFLTFIWPIIEESSTNEHYDQAITLYKHTYDFLIRTKQETKEFTKKVVKLLERDQKSHILDEKFDDAWKIIQALFQVLSDSQMKLEAVELYQENSLLFAPHRLDLALTMWSQIAEIAKEIENPNEIINLIITSVSTEIVPVFQEQQNQPAILQIHKTFIELNKTINDKEAEAKSILDVSRYLLTVGNYSELLEYGDKGLQLSSRMKRFELVKEFSDIFYGVGRGLIQDDPEIALKLISTASDSLRAYGEEGIDYYCTKFSDIYLDLYTSEIGHNLAVSERNNLLSHFKETNQTSQEGKFLLTSAKIAFREENMSEGMSLLSKATGLFKEINDEESLSEIVSICLKTASKYPIGSEEYNMLSSHANQIQNDGITISDEKTQEAFADIFDGMLDDMESLFDPKERKKRMKKGK